MTDTYVIRSPNRPLTRNAKHALKSYGIVEELDSTDSMGRNNGVRVEELPPDDVLSKHELVVEQDPVVVFETPSGSSVRVFVDPDRVIADGTETTQTPEDAVEHALDNDWDVVAGDPDAIPA